MGYFLPSFVSMTIDLKSGRRDGDKPNFSRKINFVVPSFVPSCQQQGALAAPVEQRRKPRSIDKPKALREDLLKVSKLYQ